MSLLTFVKVGGVTNLSDARYCAGMGVDLLGFNVIENTDGYVDPSKFAEIAGWVVGVDYCAELQDHKPEESLIESLNNAGISYVESCSLKVLSELGSFRRILKCAVNKADDLISVSEMITEADGIADLILIESENRELFGLLDQMLSEKVKKPIILKAYDLSEKNVQALAVHVFKGVALKGSEEIKPGYKDFDELAEILEALETD